jgi:3-(3-hydroxy-phenyl)propionate hydroxylase
VVIAGAGPAGLAAAVALAGEGVPVRVFEAGDVLAHDLRAGSYHPPTIEMFDLLGIGAAMREAGIQVRVWQVRDRGHGVVAEFDLSLLADETPYPFRLHCEQHKLTPILLERLGEFPHARCAFARTVTGFEDRGDRILVHVESVGGHETIEASYLIGADGARSVVRRGMGVEFEGFTWPERYLVASTPYDLARHGYAMNAYIADPVEWCAIFKMPHEGPPGLWRLAFPVQEQVSDDEALGDPFTRSRLEGLEPVLAGKEIAYRSIYKVHQRVAKDFRKGRAILVGDAAHINNPLGGMGLNSAIHDALNLANKLTAILSGEGPADAELERYSRQRRQVNIEFVQQLSIRNKRLLEERDPAVRRERLDDLGATSRCPDRARRHLMRTSMIESVRRAAEIV